MASPKKARLKQAALSTILMRAGVALIAAGLVILALTFGPIIYQEITYNLRQLFFPKTTMETERAIKPVDRDFGIIIPKLGANARIIANVDPYDARAYQRALTRGVAHARGTSVPGATGNMFLFAHSSENFYEAVRYNSVFYLLPKLIPGDEIIMYYKNTRYTYVVTDKKLVRAKDVSYLENGRNTQTLTLMTCWPPGTNLQRLLVFAQLKK